MTRIVMTEFIISKEHELKVRDKLPVPVTCHLCGGHVLLVNNSTIYGKEYGKWPFSYMCEDCRAYVGIHLKTDIPLGTLASKEMRAARRSAKTVLNTIIHKKLLSRPKAYLELSRRMLIPHYDCHIGWFGVDQCLTARTHLLNILSELDRA